MTSTVHFVKSGVRATIRPSTTAPQRASRNRRSRSQRPTRVPPASIIGWLYAIESTVPRWCGEPRAPSGGDSFPRSPGFAAVQKQAVDGGARTRDVRAECAERSELVGERRRGEVVHRERSEVARTPHRAERVEQRVAPLLVAALPVARVECVVDVFRRVLPLAVRDEQQDPVILRQLDRRQLGAVACAELWPVFEEVRNVCSELTRVGSKLVVRLGFVAELVRQPESRCGVRAAAAEPGRNGDPLLDARGKARTVAVGKALERSADELVTGEAVYSQLDRALHRDTVRERDALKDRDDLVPAVVPSGADDECEVDLRGSRGAFHPSASASCRNSDGASSSARTFGCFPNPAIAASACARSVKPASSSELARRLRLCAKAASTTRLTRRKSDGR